MTADVTPGCSAKVRRVELLDDRQGVSGSGVPILICDR